MGPVAAGRLRPVGRREKPMSVPTFEVDLTSPAFKADPYPFYARLRAEAPVARVMQNGRPFWLITRYDDVVALLKDERFVKDRSNIAGAEAGSGTMWLPGILKPLLRNMLDRDPPDHTRLRSLVHKGFTPRLIARMDARIQSLADALLDAAAGRSSFDLIADYAQPIPMTIIADMLGVAPADRPKFQRWSRAIVSISPSTMGMLRALPSIYLFMRFARRLIRDRRRDPQDDLVTALVQIEEAGDRLDEEELLAMIFLLLVAGHETTVNLIGNGSLALLRHPEQLARLRAEPALLETAVEELLRYDGPLETATERFARDDVTLHGITIPRGEVVYGVLAAANRDERQFPDPDTLDISRQPNRHIAFGHGIHFCLGAPLARLEGKIAFATLLRRLPAWRLAVAPESLRWNRGLVLHGLEALPLVNALT